jgi:hypothetical protein
MPNIQFDQKPKLTRARQNDSRSSPMQQINNSYTQEKFFDVIRLMSVLAALYIASQSCRDPLLKLVMCLWFRCRLF